MGFTAFVLASLCVIGSSGDRSGVAKDRVDVMEINHFYEYENGVKRLVQIIFFDKDSQGEHRVRFWRLLKTDDDKNLLPGQRPVYDYARQEWMFLFHTGDTLREVRAPYFRESWTQYDIELIDRDYLPKEQRKGLSEIWPQ